MRSGHGDFFDPTGLVLFDGGCEFDDVVDVHGLPAVEHDVDLGPDGLAKGFYHLDVFDEAFMSGHRGRVGRTISVR